MKRHSPWLKGAGAGLAIALVVLAVALSGLGEAGGPLILVRYLAAIPPFAYGPLFTTPWPAQSLVLLLWWTAAGALLGWLIGHGARGRLIAGVAAAVLALGHALTVIRIERGLAEALEALAAILRSAW